MKIYIQEDELYPYYILKVVDESWLRNDVIELTETEFKYFQRAERMFIKATKMISDKLKLRSMK
jgi:hypothetical protein